LPLEPRHAEIHWRVGLTHFASVPGSWHQLQLIQVALSDAKFAT
jgi:hypothetical protein